MLLITSLVFFSIETLLLKYKITLFWGDKRLFLWLYFITGFSVHVIVFILFYITWFKEKRAGLLCYLVRGFFFVFLIFSVAVWGGLLIIILA